MAIVQFLSEGNARHSKFSTLLKVSHTLLPVQEWLLVISPMRNFLLGWRATAPSLTAEIELLLYARRSYPSNLYKSLQLILLCAEFSVSPSSYSALPCCDPC